MIFLRSLAFAIAFYSGTVLVLLISLPIGLVSQRGIHFMARVWSRLHRITTHYLLGQKIRVDGTLPDGPHLYILKHESMFETIDLLSLLPNPVIVAKRELFDIPVWGRIARQYGLIPVERTAGASALRNMRAAARAATDAGRSIGLFPEGTRVPHGQSPPLQSGFAGLYALLRLPVVPIAIDSGRVSPRGSFLKHAGTITYKVGEVIPPGLDRAVAEARVHAAINALNRELPKP
ncbi:lysophospholipid acyltransferase family protein [Sphingobium aromaticiconvertens]|uniref:lysophospholipid acyltransferase family protein n=1 Tax=Sphingobium aromaticiconvertens TaxID=365341 RepID=UPI0030193330